MGWANCGEDSRGRPIGYAHAATCDHPECDTKIDRGLDYACGGMHGETEYGCEGYFCYKHLVYREPIGSEVVTVCNECAEQIQEEEE